MDLVDIGFGRSDRVEGLHKVWENPEPLFGVLDRHLSVPTTIVPSISTLPVNRVGARMWDAFAFN